MSIRRAYRLPLRTQRPAPIPPSLLHTFSDVGLEAPELPDFHPMWIDALRMARKEWLLEELQRIYAIGDPVQANLELAKLTPADLELIGMQRVKLEVKP